MSICDQQGGTVPVVSGLSRRHVLAIALAAGGSVGVGACQGQVDDAAAKGAHRAGATAHGGDGLANEGVSEGASVSGGSDPRSGITNVAGLEVPTWGMDVQTLSGDSFWMMRGVDPRAGTSVAVSKPLAVTRMVQAGTVSRDVMGILASERVPEAMTVLIPDALARLDFQAADMALSSNGEQEAGSAAARSMGPGGLTVWVAKPAEQWITVAVTGEADYAETMERALIEQLAAQPAVSSTKGSGS